MIIIDVEASGLHPASYPVEVGWCSHDLLTAWSSIVRPALSWTEADWSLEAQQIHGIDRSRAVVDGLPVIEVAERLNRELAGQRPLTDFPEADGKWIWRLFMEAGLQPTFDAVRPLFPGQRVRTEAEKAQIADLDADILITAAADDADLLADNVTRIANEMRADAEVKPHRALDDAIGLALDLAAVSVLRVGRDHGDVAAASLKSGMVNRARELIRQYGRRP